MRLLRLTTVLVCSGLPLGSALAQTNPVVTGWLRNTTGVRARHYLTGNPTPIQDTVHANVQQVRYSAGNVYVNCSGLPAYVTGPFNRNPVPVATNRRFLFKFPQNPQPNPGTLTPVGMGNVGVLINGVPVYNYADGFSYNNQGVWHQNAVVFELNGFDCARGHPSPVRVAGQLVGGTYHHHQNPAAFNIATVPLSTVCNVYLADGLYVPDSTRHGPLIGFAFDGYPIYGGYGYADPLVPGALRRMRPSYRTRAITARTTLPNGTPASQPGPPLATQPLGSYFEDFEYVARSGDLDAHNGRQCVTPEYPQGTYAYFATVDAAGNSVYPYILGPTYYGVVETANFPVMGPNNPPTSVMINEPVTVYSPPAPTGLAAGSAAAARVTVFPSPTHEVLVVQTTLAARTEQAVELLDLTGRVVARQVLFPGATMCYFDTQALHAGTYLVRVGGAGAVRVVVE